MACACLEGWRWRSGNSCKKSQVGLHKKSPLFLEGIFVNITKTLFYKSLGFATDFVVGLHYF